MSQRIYLQGSVSLRVKLLNGVINVAVGDSGAYVPITSITLPAVAAQGVGLSLCESKSGLAILDLQFADGTQATYSSSDNGTTWVVQD
jgi:hypothetical protein